MGQRRVGTWGFGTWGVGRRGSEAVGAEKGAAGGGAGEEGGKGGFVEGAGGADIVIEVRWWICVCPATVQGVSEM